MVFLLEDTFCRRDIITTKYSSHSSKPSHLNSLFYSIGWTVFRKKFSQATNMSYLRALCVLLTTFLCVQMCYSDCYMHNPRGSNNRLNERSANRDNANRLFDSQVSQFIHNLHTILYAIIFIPISSFRTTIVVGIMQVTQTKLVDFNLKIRFTTWYVLKHLCILHLIIIIHGIYMHVITLVNRVTAINHSVLIASCIWFCMTD